MGISWTKESVERTIAALLAAHPDLNPDYRTMAVYFGQGATYDSMHGRFREYRRMADTMQGATGGPVTTTPSRRNRKAPSTPRSRGGVAKTSSSKKQQYEKRSIQSCYNTPSKKGNIKVEMPETILLDEDTDDDDLTLLKSESGNNGVQDDIIKLESVTPMVERDVFKIKQEDRFVDSQTNGYIAPNDSTSRQLARRGGTVTDDRCHQQTEYNVEPDNGYDVEEFA